MEAYLLHRHTETARPVAPQREMGKALINALAVHRVPITREVSRWMYIHLTETSSRYGILLLKIRSLEFVSLIKEVIARTWLSPERELGRRQSVPCREYRNLAVERNSIPIQFNRLPPLQPQAGPINFVNG